VYKENRSQNYEPRAAIYCEDWGTDQGTWGMEVPSGVQRQRPWWGLGAKPPKAENFW